MEWERVYSCCRPKPLRSVEQDGHVYILIPRNLCLENVGDPTPRWDSSGVCERGLNSGRGCDDGKEEWISVGIWR